MDAADLGEGTMHGDRGLGTTKTESDLQSARCPACDHRFRLHGEAGCTYRSPGELQERPLPCPCRKTYDELRIARIGGVRRQKRRG